MTRRTVLLLAVMAVTMASCGDPGDASPTTTGLEGSVAPTTSAGSDGSTSITEPPTTPDPAQVASTNWVVVSFGLDGADDPVLPAAVPTLEFGEDGLSVSGTTGCNSYFGAATFSLERGFSFEGLGWTEMACLDAAVMEQERHFTQALSHVDGFALGPTGLVLEASDGSAIIRLIPTPSGIELPLAGDWRLVTFIDDDIALSTITGSQLTLAIDTDTGLISGNAGCNDFKGRITLDLAEDQHSASIQVGPLATTLMACEPDIMDQETVFRAVLGDASGMVVEVGFLTVVTDDGRALVFEPAEG